jgi:catechol 1,2-dioxygenase
MNHLPKTLGYDLAGERLVLSGKVLDVLCEAVEDVVLDFWQAFSSRDYDNLGYILSEKVKSDKKSNYFLNKIFLKQYSQRDIARPSHIHLKVEDPAQPNLTTQLYFEDDPYINNNLKESVIMKINKKKDTKKANFDFIIEYCN